MLVFLACPARAHDPDTVGGLYRTLDAGANWSPINPGIYPSSALALAANPRAPAQLLLGTDSGLWRSANGGRDWQLETGDLLRGPAFAAVFDLDPGRALVATGGSLLRNDGGGWRALPVPSGTLPARALTSGGVSGRVFLAGPTGLHRSDDFGASWRNVGKKFGAQPVTALLVAPARPDDTYAVAAGALWASANAGRDWRRLTDAATRVEAAGLDPSDPARLWIVAAARVHRSNDRGVTWQLAGPPLPDIAAKARAILANGDTLLVATDRGLFHSTDGGVQWDAPKENLPAHLSAAVLVRDAGATATLYAGFAITRYEELLAQVPSERPYLLDGIRATIGEPAVVATSIGLLLAVGGAVVLVARYRARRGTVRRHAAHAAVDPN